MKPELISDSAAAAVAAANTHGQDARATHRTSTAPAPASNAARDSVAQTILSVGVSEASPQATATQTGLSVLPFRPRRHRRPLTRFLARAAALGAAVTAASLAPELTNTNTNTSAPSAPSALAALLAPAAAASTMPDFGFEQTISVNFKGNGSEVNRDNPGAVPTPAASWINYIGGTGSLALTKNHLNQTISGITLNVTTPGLYAVRDGSANTGNAQLSHGILDNYNGPITLTISGLSTLFTSDYTVYLYFSNSDNANYHAFRINGTYYVGGTDTSVASASDQQFTGTQNIWTGLADGALVNGTHYLKVEDQTLDTLNIYSAQSANNVNGEIAGFQVSKVVGRTAAEDFLFWDGAAASWDNQAANTAFHIGSNTGTLAAFSADKITVFDTAAATNISLGETVAVDGLWVKSGDVTLSGNGALTLTSRAGRFAIDSGTSLTLAAAGTYSVNIPATVAFVVEGTLNLNKSLALDAALSGSSGTINVAAAGTTTTLTSAKNTYSGTYNVADGATLRVSGAGTLGAADTTTALSFGGASAALEIARDATAPSGAVFSTKRAFTGTAGKVNVAAGEFSYGGNAASGITFNAGNYAPAPAPGSAPAHLTLASGANVGTAQVGAATVTLESGSTTAALLLTNASTLRTNTSAAGPASVGTLTLNSPTLFSDTTRWELLGTPSAATSILTADSVTLNGASVTIDISAIISTLTANTAYTLLSSTAPITKNNGSDFQLSELPLGVNVSLSQTAQNLVLNVESVGFHRYVINGSTTGNFTNMDRWTVNDTGLNTAALPGNIYRFENTAPLRLHLAPSQTLRLVGNVASLDFNTPHGASWSSPDKQPVTDSMVVGLYVAGGGGVNSGPVTISGGVIDTGTVGANPSTSLAILVRSTSSPLIIRSKVIGSGTIARLHNGSGSNTVTVIDNDIGLQLQGDFSEYTGTIYGAGGARGVIIGDGTILGTGATVALTNVTYTNSNAYIVGNVDFGAKLVKGAGDFTIRPTPGYIVRFTGTAPGWYSSVGDITWTTGGTVAISSWANVDGGSISINGRASTLQLYGENGTVITAASGKSISFTNAETWIKVGTSDPRNDLLDPISITYSGTLGGTTARKTGKGELVVTVRPTYSGDTWIDEGQLKIYNPVNSFSSILGSATSAIRLLRPDTALIYDARNASNAITNVISGSGQLIKRGGETTVTTNSMTIQGTTNTFSGGLRIEFGRINLTGSAGGGAIEVWSGGQILLFRANTDWRNNLFITGSGVQESSGTIWYGAIRLDESATSKISGDITVVPNPEAGIYFASINGSAASGGTLRIAGNIIGATNAILRLGQDATSSNTGVTNGHIFSLTGENADWFGTIDVPTATAGVLRIGDGGNNGNLPNAAGITLGAASKLIANTTRGAEGNGTTLATGADLIIGGNITGGGTFEKQGSGTAILTGVASNFGGSTITVSAGALFVRGGGVNNVVVNTAANTVFGLTEGGSVQGTVNITNGATFVSGRGSVTGALNFTGTTATVRTTAVGDFTSVGLGGTHAAKVSFDLGPLYASLFEGGATGTQSLAVLGYSGLTAGALPTASWDVTQSGTYRPAATPTLTYENALIKVALTAAPNVLQWDTGSGNWQNGLTGWNVKTSGGALGVGNSTEFYTGDAVYFSGNTASINVTADVFPAAVIVENASGSTYTIGGTGKISGTGTKLYKDGTGTLTLSTANAYTGGTFVNSVPTGSTNTLVVNNVGALGSGPVTLGDNALLDISATSEDNAATGVRNAVIVNAPDTATVVAQGPAPNTAGVRYFNTPFVGDGILNLSTGAWINFPTNNRVTARLGVASPDFTGEIHLSTWAKFYLNVEGGDWRGTDFFLDGNFAVETSSSATSYSIENLLTAYTGTIHIAGSGYVFVTGATTLFAKGIIREVANFSALGASTTNNKVRAGTVDTSRLSSSSPDGHLVLGNNETKVPLWVDIIIGNATTDYTNAAAFGKAVTIVKEGKGVVSLTQAPQHTGGYIINEGILVYGAATPVNERPPVEVKTSDGTVAEWKGRIVVNPKGELWSNRYFASSVDDTNSRQFSAVVVGDNVNSGVFGANCYTRISDITLNGGTLYGLGTHSGANWGSWQIRDKVVVSADRLDPDTGMPLLDPVTGEKLKAIDGNTGLPVTPENPLISYIKSEKSTTDFEGVRMGYRGSSGNGLFTFQVEEAAKLIISASVRNDGNGSPNDDYSTGLRKTGAGELVLGAGIGFTIVGGATTDSLYRGPTYVDGGKLVVGRASQSSYFIAKPNTELGFTDGIGFYTAPSFIEIQQDARLILDFALPYTLNLTSPIEGAGDIVKTGPGTVTLGTAVYLFGEAEINAGALVLSTTGELANISGLSLTGNTAVFDISAKTAGFAPPSLTGDASGAQIQLGTRTFTVPVGDYAGSFIGSGTLEKTTNATLRLSGASPSLTGPANITGIVSVAQTYGLGKGALTFAAGAALEFKGNGPDGAADSDFDRYSHGEATVTLLGALSVRIAGAGKRVLFGDVSSTRTIAISGGVVGTGNFAGTLAGDNAVGTGVAVKAGATIATVTGARALSVFGEVTSGAGYGTGTISSFNSESFSGIRYDVRIAADTPTNHADKVTVGGDVTFGTTSNSINLSQWLPGNYEILTATGTMSNFYQNRFTLSVAGSPVSGLANRKDVRIWQTASSLWIQGAYKETELEWKGGAALGWTESRDVIAWYGREASSDTSFAPLDTVIFNERGAASNGVNIAASYTVGAWTITDDVSGNATRPSYSFDATQAVTISGAASDTDAQVESWAINKLTVSGGALATFSSNVALNFKDFLITGTGTDGTNSYASSALFNGAVTASASLTVAGGANADFSGALTVGATGATVTGTDSVLRVAGASVNAGGAAGAGFSALAGGTLEIAAGTDGAPSAISTEKIAISGATGAAATLKAAPRANTDIILNAPAFSDSLVLGAVGANIEVAAATSSGTGRLVINRTISGGALTKTGAGELALTATDNSFDGVTVAAGTLSVSHLGNLGTDKGTSTVVLGKTIGDVVSLRYERPLLDGEPQAGAVLDLIGKLTVTSGVTAKFDTGSTATSTEAAGLADSGEADSGARINLGTLLSTGVTLQNIGGGTVALENTTASPFAGTVSGGKWSLPISGKVNLVGPDTSFFAHGAVGGTIHFGAFTDGVVEGTPVSNLMSGVALNARLEGTFYDKFRIDTATPVFIGTGNVLNLTGIWPALLPGQPANEYTIFSATEIDASWFTSAGGVLPSSTTFDITAADILAVGATPPLVSANVNFNGLPLESHRAAKIFFVGTNDGSSSTLNSVRISFYAKYARLSWTGGEDENEDLLVWSSATQSAPWLGIALDAAFQETFQDSYFLHGDIVTFGNKATDEKYRTVQVVANQPGDYIGGEFLLQVGAMNVTQGGYTFRGAKILGVEDLSADYGDDAVGAGTGILSVRYAQDLSTSAADTVFQNTLAFQSVTIVGARAVFSTGSALTTLGDVRIFGGGALQLQTTFGADGTQPQASTQTTIGGALRLGDIGFDAGGSLLPTDPAYVAPSGGRIELVLVGNLPTSGTAARVTISQPVILAGDTATADIRSGAELSFNLPISGTVPLTKIGTGTLLLTGTALVDKDDPAPTPAPYDSAVTVRAGKIQLSDTEALGSAQIAIETAGTLRVATNGTFDNSLTGTGTFLVETNTLTLASDNSASGPAGVAFTGTVRVNGNGTLLIDDLSAVGDANFEFGDSLAGITRTGTLDLTGIGATALDLGNTRTLSASGKGGIIHLADGATLSFGGEFISGAFSFTQTAGPSPTAIVLSGDNSDFTAASGDANKVAFGSGITVTLDHENALGSAAITLERTNSALLATLTLGSSVDNVVFANKFSGAGTILLDAKKVAFSNTATDFFGTVELRNGSELTLAGATLGSAVIEAGFGTTGGDKLIATDNGVASNTIALGAKGASIIIPAGKRLEITGKIWGGNTSGEGTLTVSGGGTFALSGINNASGINGGHTGRLVIESGTLEIKGGADSIAGQGGITLGVSAPVTVLTSATTTANFGARAITIGQTSTFDIHESSHWAVIGGAILGSAPIVKTGLGLLQITGPVKDGFFGLITMNPAAGQSSAGTLQIDSSNAFANATGLDASARSALVFNATQTFKQLLIGTNTAVTVAPGVGLRITERLDLQGRLNSTVPLTSLVIEAGAELTITRTGASADNGIIKANNISIGGGSTLNLDTTGVLEATSTMQLNGLGSVIHINITWDEPMPNYVIARAHDFEASGLSDDLSVTNSVEVRVGKPGASKAKVPVDPSV
ncbi:MAG: autotransporter-associated beta strand repeat-containing protein, partial [Puniceicoccales bacterium]|nr:autotransporter-associated beta strand repeat-containing protein [Puniceicoccales bacterium]